MYARGLSLRTVLFLGLTFPFFTAYCIFSNIGLLAYFIICSQYIAIQQKAHLQLIRTFQQRLTRKVSYSVIATFWRQFIHLNEQQIWKRGQMATLNHFWGLFLSVYFLGYILLICYMAYCFLFTPSSFFARSLFLFLGANNVALLFLVIHQCANLIKANRRIGEYILKCCIFFQSSTQKVPVANGRNCPFKLSDGRLVKTQTIVSNQYVDLGFMLNNGHMINSNTYHLVRETVYC